MRRLIHNRDILAAILLACMFTSAVRAQSASEVVDRLKARFDETGVFSASFRQTVDDSFGNSGRATTLSGSILVGTHGYRVEMPDQIVVTDEITTWVYLIRDQQVIINDYVEDDGSFSPSQFIGDGADRYDARFADVSSADHYVVVLTPQSPDSYIETATLWVRKGDYIVARIDVVDVNGASIQFEMSNVNFRPEVPDNAFQFDIPEGIEVIDLRS
jgi:outer membrane lipoprotein carrier protein